MTELLRIPDWALDRPALISHEKAQVIFSALVGRMEIETPTANRFEGDQRYHYDGCVLSEKNDGFNQEPYRVVGNGTAVITVDGMLVNRGKWIGARGGFVSYEFVQHALMAAREDAGIRSVIVDLNTPGGEAIGAFETADVMREVAAVKPVTAFINGMAASAGYAIASGANRIVTIRSGCLGSIGVVWLHTDMSKAFKASGITPTLIFAGDHKVDGNSYEPLPDHARAYMQSRVNKLYGQFIETVAAGRGEALSADAARETKAEMFDGQDAVDAGLADATGTFESVLSELSNGVNGTPSSLRRNSMPNPNTRPNSDTQAQTSGIPQADHDAAVAAARTEGATQERARIVGILSSEGVAGNAARMSMALELAADAPDMTAEKVAAHALKAGAPATGADSDDHLSLINRGSVPDSLAQASMSQQPEKPKSGLSTLVDRVAPSA